MKKTLIALMLATSLSAPVMATNADDLEACSMMGKIAESVYQGKEAGVPLSTTIENAQTAGLSNILITMIAEMYQRAIMFDTSSEMGSYYLAKCLTAG